MQGQKPQQEKFQCNRVYPVLVRYTRTETVTLEVLFATLWLFCVMVILYFILSFVVDIALDVAMMPPTLQIAGKLRNSQNTRFSRLLLRKTCKKAS